MQSYYAKFNDLLVHGGKIQRETVLSGPDLGAERLLDDGKEAARLGNFEGNDILREDISPRPHLFVFGGGHVSLALYKFSVLLSLPFDVWDDLPEYANRERFPLARGIHNCSIADLAKKPIAIPGAYFIIATRGCDGDALSIALRSHYAYIGMMGSKTKVQSLEEELKKREGFTDEDFKDVHAPVGLPIGGDTPEEIALSIMSEVQMHATGGKHRTVTDPEEIQKLAEAQERTVLVRVVGKKGSGPATPGAMMLVTKDGTYGTVGGGMIEKTAVDTARTVTEPLLREYDLSAKGDLGMTCGGHVRLLYTVVHP